MGAGVEEALAVEADVREAEEPAEAGDQGELRNAECGAVGRLVDTGMTGGQGPYDDSSQANAHHR